MSLVFATISREAKEYGLALVNALRLRKENSAFSPSSLSLLHIVARMGLSEGAQGNQDRSSSDMNRYPPI